MGMNKGQLVVLWGAVILAALGGYFPLQYSRAPLKNIMNMEHREDREGKREKREKRVRGVREGREGRRPKTDNKAVMERLIGYWVVIGLAATILIYILRDIKKVKHKIRNFSMNKKQTICMWIGIVLFALFTLEVTPAIGVVVVTAGLIYTFRDKQKPEDKD
jgi:hypothetical protein